MTVFEALPMDINSALYNYCKDDECLNDAMLRALRNELKIDQVEHDKYSHDCLRCDKFKENKNCIAELEKEKCKLLGIIQDKDKFINDLRNDWIDLASNSDNLPEYEQPVEIWLEGCDYPRVAYRESLGGGTWRWWVYWGSGYEIGNKSIVVAWRKIVPPKRS